MGSRRGYPWFSSTYPDTLQVGLELLRAHAKLGFPWIFAPGL